MRSNNEILLLVDSYQYYLRFYYADGHCEMKNSRVKHYMQENRKGYKNPICVQNDFLYPTKNIHDSHCQWINLDFYEENNHCYSMVLDYYDLNQHVKKMYIKHKYKK